MAMEKRIITWNDGNDEKQSEWTFSRGFIFGNYGWSAADYQVLIDEAMKDFPHLTLKDIQLAFLDGSRAFWVQEEKTKPTPQRRENGRGGENRNV